MTDGTATPLSTVTLRHGKSHLALHQLQDGTGHPLLLLHGLGERTPERVPTHLDWRGPVWGLDFTGHGGSTIPEGGGYTAEILMADADAALAQLGEVTLLGRGLGAYVALLLAGARPELVRGAILTDGPGLAGGGPSPGSPASFVPAATSAGPPDPLALFELSRDIRPPDYATAFARQALQFSKLDPALVVAAVVRPDWLRAVAGEPGVAELDLAGALRLYGLPWKADQD